MQCPDVRSIVLVVELVLNQLLFTDSIVLRMQNQHALYRRMFTLKITVHGRLYSMSSRNNG